MNGCLSGWAPQPNELIAASTKLNDIAARSCASGAKQDFAAEDTKPREAWFATVIDNCCLRGSSFSTRIAALSFATRAIAIVYGMEPEQVAPGTRRPASLIKRRLELGLKVRDNPEEYVRQRISKEVTASKAIQELADGSNDCL